MEAGLRGLRSSRRIPVIQYNDEDEVKLPKPRERSVAVEEEQPKKETSKQNLSSLMFDFDIKQDNLSDAEFESVKRLYDALKDPKRSKARSIPELMKDIGLTEEEKNLIVSEMRSMPKDETLHVDTTHQGEYDRVGGADARRFEHHVHAGCLDEGGGEGDREEHSGPVEADGGGYSRRCPPCPRSCRRWSSS